VRVTATTEGTRVRIAVRDNGKGIAEADLGRVFDRFYRGEGGGKPGSGLGLAIARSHARAMGGELTVESTQGQGAAFVLELELA
jgi:signal transduction histidine kinase